MRARIAPTVHCLAAPPLRAGSAEVRGMPMIVSLETALWLRDDYGWYVVGQDPEDMFALARWEKEAEPFNPPRRSR